MKIRKTKKSLLESGDLKKNKLEPIKDEYLILDMLPDCWGTVVFDDIFRFIDYRGKTPTKTNHGKRLITAKNIKITPMYLSCIKRKRRINFF